MYNSFFLISKNTDTNFEKIQLGSCLENRLWNSYAKMKVYFGNERNGRFSFVVSISQWEFENNILTEKLDTFFLPAP